jgi:hypothetical protein
MDGGAHWVFYCSRDYRAASYCQCKMLVYRILKGLDHRIDYKNSLKIEVDRSRHEEGMRQELKFFRGSFNFKIKKYKLLAVNTKLWPVAYMSISFS